MPFCLLFAADEHAMSKTISKFRFKSFAVSHHRSTMKVGVDGVLIGCWADVGGAGRILDVGTGCGLIALIMAQRAPEARIDAIDIDAPSIEEANENISDSPWPDRVKAFCCSYTDIPAVYNACDGGYDLIISNPPYFDSGVEVAVTRREKARHQGELSPSLLLSSALRLLKKGGKVAMEVPSDIMTGLEADAHRLGYRLVGKCLVKGHKDAQYKRVLLQWTVSDMGDPITSPSTEYLTLESSPGVPTDEYRSLCKDFYLKF